MDATVSLAGAEFHYQDANKNIPVMKLPFLEHSHMNAPTEVA